MKTPETNQRSANNSEADSGRQATLKVKIDLLADKPELIADLAPEIALHWSALVPEETVASRTAKLQTHLCRDRLPIAWVAHSDGEAMGTAALRVHDLDGREDLSPWLGGVFVLKKFRGKGLASQLCKVTEAKAWDFGIERLYLFTIDHQLMYSKLGWNVLDRADWRGRESSIMFKNRP